MPRRESCLASEGWSVYIIRASDGSLYTGISTDPVRRMAQHLAGVRAGGARYFCGGRRPIALCWREDGHSRASASRREAQIKRMDAQAKAVMVCGGPVADGGRGGDNHGS